MSFRRPSRSLARLWALLFVAFLVVGLSAGIATLHLALDQYTTDLRTDLLNTARLMAMSVDASDHERLKKLGISMLTSFFRNGCTERVRRSLT